MFQRLKIRSLFLLLLYTATMASPGWAAVAKTEKVNKNCAQCHGSDGNARDKNGNDLIGPSLANQVPEYITEQLMHFSHEKDKDNKPLLGKNGKLRYKRYAVYMSPLASVLDYQSMVNFGHMYNNYQAKIPALRHADPQKIELGRLIWRAGIPSRHVPACAACHGVVGQGLPKLFPRLGGQSATYIEKQLNNFQMNKRPGGFNNMMKMIADRLTTQEMQSVALYASGLDFNPQSDFIGRRSPQSDK